MKTLPIVELDLDACWRRIGVSGDRSCGELARHIHCRNCNVYAGAAQRNLQRPVEPSYREDWARELARQETAAAPRDAAALVFRVGAEWLAVPMALAAAVAPRAPVHRVPHRGGALLGMVNVDGRLVPAVSLARLLHIADRSEGTVPAGRHVFARLLVLAVDGQAFALPVDEVRGVQGYAAGAMRPSPAGADAIAGALLAGVIAADGVDAGLLAAGPLGERLKELLR